MFDNIKVYQPRMPGIVVGVQVTEETAKLVAELCNGRVEHLVVSNDPETDPIFIGIKVRTRTRFKIAAPGDYVIMDSKGLFDVKVPLDFNSEYEVVETN